MREKLESTRTDRKQKRKLITKIIALSSTTALMLKKKPIITGNTKNAVFGF